MFNHLAYKNAQQINFNNIDGIICMDTFKKEFVNPLFTGQITYINSNGKVTEIRYFKNGKKFTSITFN